MSWPELLIYTVRPDGTSLWVPDWIANRLGLKRGDRLTVAQYESPTIQELLEVRIRAESGDGRLGNDFMTTNQTKGVRAA